MWPVADSHLSRANNNDSSIFPENRQELWQNSFGLKVIDVENKEVKLDGTFTDNLYMY